MTFVTSGCVFAVLCNFSALLYLIASRIPPGRVRMVRGCRAKHVEVYGFRTYIKKRMLKNISVFAFVVS